jgi:hypothetical protein
MGAYIHALKILPLGRKKNNRSTATNNLIHPTVYHNRKIAIRPYNATHKGSVTSIRKVTIFLRKITIIGYCAV